MAKPNNLIGSQPVTSIRTFLIGVLLSTFTLLNFVAVVKGYKNGLDTVRTVLDEQLRDVALLLAVHSTRVVRLGEFDKTYIAYQVIRDSRLQERSFNAPSTVVTELTPGFGHKNFDHMRWRTYTHYESESDTWVWVAEPEQQRDRIAESVVFNTVMPILIGIPLAGILIWLIVGAGLRPLKSLSTQLEKKQPSDLSPLTVDQRIPKELIPVVTAINQLLTRLLLAFQREKHFAADAAHELRTPVSVLKVQIHNLESTLTGKNADLSIIKKSVDQLARLVEQLLDLYRSSPDLAFQQVTLVNMDTLAQEILAEAFYEAEEKQQMLELFAAPMLIKGNPFALRTLLRNLVANSVKYTPPHGTIRVSLGASDGHPQITVEDSGPGIPTENRTMVLQRFYRQSDQADKVPGAGLGLAIVAQIVAQHRASLSLGKSADLGGLEVTVIFPPGEPFA